MAQVALLLCLGLAPTLAHGDSSPTAPAQEDFGQYVAKHQSDLEPFFSKNRSDLIRQIVPLVLEWLGGILTVTLLIGWGIDVLLGRGYAALFAPALVTFKPAFIYATGRLVLTVGIMILWGSAVFFAASAPHLKIIVVLLVVVFVFVSTALQVGWIYYLYRTQIPIAVLFYLTLVVVHGFLTLGVSSVLAHGRASRSATAFMDQTLTPRIEAEVQSVRQELATVAPARDQAAAEAARLQDRIDQARAEQTEVQKQIDEARNSENYLYSQIVKVHAGGDLVGARNQFTALLGRFPNGPMTGLVRGQLIQVTSELSAQDAEKKQAAAQAARVAARAQAALLARAARGQATLSEMRRALIGKSRAEVSALLGPPTETASDRWGFSREMILNPLTNTRSGLAVYFSDGAVQGVDYYAGRGADR
jgi:hypothetical protein